MKLVLKLKTLISFFYVSVIFFKIFQLIDLQSNTPVFRFKFHTIGQAMYIFSFIDLLLLFQMDKKYRTLGIFQFALNLKSIYNGIILVCKDFFPVNL